MSEWTEQEVSAAEVERSRTAYWALVDRMDQMIGEILQAMHANGLAEDTLVPTYLLLLLPLRPELSIPISTTISRFISK
eukprot:COSAG05_NODE_3723_length_1881_cov_3.555805_3_plen_79_part_00